MNNHTTVRSYLRSDREACLNIFDLNCPKFFGVDERSGLELWLNSQDSGKITYESSMADFFYVILKDFEVIGCGGFYIVKDNHIARITWGMVHPDHQNQGYGKKLLDLGVKQIDYLFPTYSIELDTSQHTFPFFEKLEFKTKRIIHDAYKQGLHRYDMVRKPKQA